MNSLTSTSANSHNSAAPSAADTLLREAMAPVADLLAQLDSRLISLVPVQSETSQAVIAHVFAGGGKRIRPALYFFCTRLVGYEGPHLFPIGAVCEYVHTASLLHDDVVDDSTLRRNKPTSNAIWGDQASVLVGDLIYARASQLMAETGSLEIVSTFAQAIRAMSEGELLQLENAFNTSATEAKYLEILRCKTAVLIAASCRAAGILAGRSAAECDALSEFGRSVGMAFQLIDDALDYLGSREIFGKPTQSDLLEGKVTLPILLLRDLATPVELDSLHASLNKPTIEASDVAFAAGLVERYGTAIKTIQLAQEYTDRAHAALACFPESAARLDLSSLADRLVWRHA